MKQIITIIATITLMFCLVGCSDKKSQEKRAIIKTPYFNSETSWAFRLDDHMETFNWYGAAPGPKISNDVQDNEEQYIIWYDFEPWYGGECRVVKEIHLRKDQEINPGAENRGKSGTYPWHKVD